VQVLDETNGEVVYTLRIRGSAWQPPIYRLGKYTIRVSHGVRQKELVGIQATEQSKTEVLRVDLSAG